MDKPQIIERYYNLSIRYLSYRPRSEKEIVDYLEKKIKNQKSKGKIESQNERTIDDELIESIIKKLKDYKFIDDAEFVKFWIEQRIKFKHKPLRAIEYELKQKGIDKNLIDNAMDEFDKSTFDLENAKKLAERKSSFYRNLSQEKRKEKVMNYLLRKGFSYDVVKKIEF
jgi:regulatory protein